MRSIQTKATLLLAASAIAVTATALPIIEPTSTQKNLGEPQQEDGKSNKIDPDLAKLAREVAGEYRLFGRVDDEIRWAPYLCRMPSPSTGRISEAPRGPHGRKLYYVYAKDREAYLKVSEDEGGGESAIGQIIVKEAYVPVVCGDGDLPTIIETPTESPIKPAVDSPKPKPTDDEKEATYGRSTPYAAFDGKLMRAGDLHGLYIMARAEPSDSNDLGWIYATVAVDGTVTGAGKMRKCMSCHEEAGEGRLFGMKEPELLVNPLRPEKYTFIPAKKDDGASPEKNGG